MFRFIVAVFFVFVLSSFLWLDEVHDWRWGIPVNSAPGLDTLPKTKIPQLLDFHHQSAEPEGPDQQRAEPTELRIPPPDELRRSGLAEPAIESSRSADPDGTVASLDVHPNQDSQALSAEIGAAAKASADAESSGKDSDKPPSERASVNEGIVSSHGSEPSPPPSPDYINELAGTLQTGSTANPVVETSPKLPDAASAGQPSTVQVGEQPSTAQASDSASADFDRSGQAPDSGESALPKQGKVAGLHTAEVKATDTESSSSAKLANPPSSLIAGPASVPDDPINDVARKPEVSDPQSLVGRSATTDALADPQLSTKVVAQASNPDAVKASVRGVSDKEIRFGIVAPFSGSAKELGRQMKLGIETAFGVANAAGGVHGRQLKLFSADDGYEPSRTGEAMKQLWENDRMFGSVGNVGTPTAAVALPFALEHKMLFFGAFTGANLLRMIPPDHYVFNYRASYVEETEAAVRYLVKVRGIQPREIAVFAQQDAFGDAGYEGVAKAVRSLRGGSSEPILRLNYKRNTVDVTEAVTSLRSRKAMVKAVVMVATYRAAANFIEKTRERYPHLIYTNVSFVGSTALADELMLQGAKFADGVIVTQVVPAVNGYSRAILEYRSALAKYFPGEAPDYVSLEGYITAKLLIEGLKRAGPQLDTEVLIDALENIRDLDLGLGTTLNFGPSEHQASHKVWGTQLDAAGHFKPIDLE